MVTKGHHQSRPNWLLSCSKSVGIEVYPDSLDNKNLILDSAVVKPKRNEEEDVKISLWQIRGDVYYDSMDSTVSSLYRTNGEDLAECDSLEKYTSNTSDICNKK